MNRPIKIAAFTVYFLALLLVSGKLFFEKQFDAAVSSVMKSFSSTKAQTLVIGFSEPMLSFDPLANDTGSRTRLLHIYEALVRVTPDLQIEPALAASFGSPDDLTWEFRLRPNVLFHDGKKLTLDDVIYSLQEAAENPNSGVKDLASTIKEIKKMDDQIFQIVTSSPDPLLLQKLSYMLIFPKNAAATNRVGTGPYMLEKNEGGTLQLKRFANYWDKLAPFDTAILKTFASKKDKIAALGDGTVDLIANVPPDSARDFSYSGFTLKTLPSLEVNFLMFNFDRTFKSLKLREAVADALKIRDIVKLTQGFAVPATQFVGNGTFGYDPSIKFREPDVQKAEELVKELANFSRIKTTLDLPKGLEVFGAAVKDQLAKVGIDVELIFLTPVELSEKIKRRQSDFYFFGWRTDLGDAADFLTAVVHSPAGNFGQYNGSNYRSSEADRLIELSAETIKSDKRLEKLRAVMRKITVDDIIGVPLFSQEVLYGVSDKIKWQPRVDGYILAQEVKM
ncbi:hypothetical protein HZA42_00165 [Candidatus Peregrinibacteria bacterium]|nr:hypothetical protein [Candidatus Peregrinibacteria bacterium]